MPGFEFFGDKERAQVQDVLDSGVLMRYGFDGMRNNHWKAKELEEALTKRMDVNHAQLVSSGTAALTVALASAGIGAGDEVIMPTFTFVASFESILALGAVPVLVDAGVGTASHAAIAMELGCDGVLMNTAIAAAENPELMAAAMKNAVIAGRQAYLAGRMEEKQYGAASSPVDGKITKAS